MAKIDLNYLRGVMENVCIGIQHEFLNWTKQTRRLLTGTRCLTKHFTSRTRAATRTEAPMVLCRGRQLRCSRYKSQQNRTPIGFKSLTTAYRQKKLLRGPLTNYRNDLNWFRWRERKTFKECLNIRHQRSGSN